MDGATLHLHSYFRSSCSARVRTAAALKGIPLTYTHVHLLHGGQLAADYARVNPSRSVPTLTVTRGGSSYQVTQSVAILELLEEQFPDRRPLLPSREDAAGRARVRDLVNVIACDVQPPTNLRILKRVTGAGGDSAAWAKEVMAEGLRAFEQLAAPSAGRFSYGDEVTLADVVLAPAVENAIRFKVDTDEFPTINRVFENVRGMDEFKKADWRHQEDTPEELRARD